MVVKFDFDVLGERQLSREIHQMADRIKDLSPAFDNIARDFYQVERDQFSSSGQGAWAPLSERTIAKKGSSRILYDRGELQASLTRPDHPRSLHKIENLRMEVGTTHPAAAFHQKGTTFMPKREVIRIREDVKRRWMKYIQRHLVELKTGRPT